MRKTFIHWMEVKTIMRMLMKVIYVYLQLADITTSPQIDRHCAPLQMDPWKVYWHWWTLKATSIIVPLSMPVIALVWISWCTLVHKINIGETTFSGRQLIIVDNESPWLTGSFTHRCNYTNKHKYIKTNTHKYNYTKATSKQCYNRVDSTNDLKNHIGFKLQMSPASWLEMVSTELNDQKGD